MMVFWQPITNLREYVASKPPGATFFLCLLILAVSFICFSVYTYTHSLPNPDIVKDWNYLLASIAQHRLCEKNSSFASAPYNKDSNVHNSTTMEVSVDTLHVRVPLSLVPKSDSFGSISLHTSFSSHQLQLEGNETYNVTIHFSVNDSNACLVIKAPSHLLSLHPVPPTCLQRFNSEDAVYTEASALMLPTQKCYRLQSIFDPRLQVMLTKEDQLVAVHHLLEVAVVLLGVCLILCLSASQTSPTWRHSRTEQDLHHLEPLIDN